MQIVAFALEKRVLFDVQHDIQIARRPAMSSSFPQPRKTDSSAIFNSGGHLGVDCSLSQHATFALALGARIGNHAARALTCGASTRHAEEPLLVANLPASSAGPARDRRFAGCRAVAVAVFASGVVPNRNLGFRAEHRLFKFQRDILAQIGTALGTAASSRTSTEKISEAEKVAEDFADILKNCGIESTPASAAHRRMSEAVVGRALVGVRQNRVSLAALFEFFFRVGIVRVAIRMKLQRQLAIGALDLLLVGSAGNPEYFVIVAFYVAGQNGSRSFRLELMLGIARNFDHRGAQQAIFQLVTTLQFFEYLMIFGVGGFNHLDGFMKVGIEGLALRRNGA